MPRLPLMRTQHFLFFDRSATLAARADEGNEGTHRAHKVDVTMFLKWKKPNDASVATKLLHI
jgi:hypothetical protein